MKLQASLAEAEEKLSSKFPADGTSSQSGTAAGSSQVQIALSAHRLGLVLQLGHLRYI